MKYTQFKQLVLTAGSGIIYVAYRCLLPTPPETIPVNAIDIAILIVFGASILVPLWKLRSKIGAAAVASVVIFTVALVMGIISSYPQYKTTAAADKFNADRKFAASKGAELGKSVAEKTITPEQATKQLEQVVGSNNENLNIAKQSLEIATSQPDKRPEDIVSTVVTTIPLKMDSWSCNQLGCSYTNGTYVWTLSNSFRAVGIVLTAFAIAGLVWTKLKYLLA